MFWLKKTVSYWLMPLPLILVLLVLGLWLTRSSRSSRTGRRFLWLAAILLLQVSNKAVSTRLVRPLELAYPAIPEFAAGEPLPAKLAAVRYIVVLGGGHSDTITLSATSKLSVSSRGRLMEALRLLHALPSAQLVVSGGGAPDLPTHAAVQAQAAISLGIDPGRITRLDKTRDTDDEANEIRRLVGREPFALVTSAWHMRRAMALMHHVGLDPIPCPADYLVRPSDESNSTDWTWDADSLGRSTWAIYERLGYTWAWLQGKT